MPDKEYITVSQLNYYINNVFMQEELLHNVPVIGEVSCCSAVKGNCYFTLKDENAQIKVVYFRADKRQIPTNGERVLVRGMVDYYQIQGTVSIRAYEITRFGIGEMHARLQALKEKLASQGYFDETHKKIIPTYPRNVAVITSVKGAALQDILSTFAKNNSKQNLSIIDVRVQGESCISDVCTALQYADSFGYDVIILARGGGSFEDLYPFNDERIVKAIYDMNTPIITGVGHETDYTLCDFVSDYRAITPTAAAEKVAVNHQEKINTIFHLLHEIQTSTFYAYKKEKEKIYHSVNLIANNAKRTISLQYNRIEKSLSLSKIYMNNIFARKSTKYSELISLLDNLNPSKLLKKGYFRIVVQNKTVNTLKNIKVNSEIAIYGDKEKINAIVTKKEKI